MAGLMRSAIVAALVVAAVWMSGVFGSLQRSFLYFPLAQEPPPIASAFPGSEEIRFTTSDGVELRGWYRAAPAGGATVLVFNGNAGDRSHRAPLGLALAERGFGVLLFDYRGYAGNTGTPSEAGLLEDGRAAAAALEQRGVRDIAYFGESLGAAVAVQLAVERPPRALVLRSPFTSLEDMARLHYPWLPVGPLLVERYDSIGHITRVTAPVLVIAGSVDSIVPAAHSRRLFDAANEPKRWLEIADADHNDLKLLAGQQLILETTTFIRAVGQ